MEHTLFEYEEHHTRGEVADVLRELADELDGDGEVTLPVGDNATVTPTDILELDLEVEREGPQHQPHEVELEIELEWDSEPEHEEE